MFKRATLTLWTFAGAVLLCISVALTTFKDSDLPGYGAMGMLVFPIVTLIFGIQSLRSKEPYRWLAIASFIVGAILPFAFFLYIAGGFLLLALGVIHS